MAQATEDTLAADLVATPVDETVDASPALDDPSGHAGPAKPLAGSHVGRYLVLSELGAGAMGVVYAAYDPELDRKIALKLLRIHAGGEARTRLQREAQALAKLNHANVVAVHDVGVHADQVFVAMEFIQGQTLDTWMHAMGEPRPWREIAQVFEAAGHGLAAAHAQGLIHRDFKPDNVMIGDDGRVRVMDFGLARASEHGPIETETDVVSTASSSMKLDPQLTRTGAMMGTPAYMAPEQFAGRDITALCDQFAFCVALHEALYGQRPFEGDSLGQLALAVLEGDVVEPPRHRLAKVPAWLYKLVLRGLAVRPEERFESMQALLSTLRSGENRRWRRLAVLGVGAIGLSAATSYGYQHYDAQQRTQACADRADAIDELWNGSTRAALIEGVLATERTYARGVADKVTPWLDRQADAWRSATNTACMNATVLEAWTADQSARADWCLAQRRSELSTLIRGLTQPEARAVEVAIEVATELAHVEGCVDEAALASMGAPPEAAQRAEVEALRANLTQASYLERIGEHEAGLQIAREVEAEAEVLGWAPLVAQAQLSSASLLASAGDHAGAEEAAVVAYMDASRARSWADASSAALLLSRVVGDALGRPSEGRLWAEHAAVGIALAGDALGLDEAQRVHTLAVVAAAAGEHERARELHAEVLGLLEDILGPDHPRVAQTLTALAQAHAALGEHEQALSLYERALDMRREAFGPEHPEVAATLHELAASLTALGDHERALAHNLEALELREQAFDAAHPELAESLDSHGRLLATLGEHEQARDALARALAIHEQTLASDHPDLIDTRYQLGATRDALGEHELAREDYARALEVWDARLAGEDPRLHAVLLGLGRLTRIAAEHDEALGLLERALELGEASRGPEHPDHAHVLVELGQVHRARGAHRKALDAFTRARELCSPDHPRLADSLLGEGRSLVELGDHELGLVTLEQVLELRAAEHTELQLAEARAALALVLWDAPSSGPAERARAHELATWARAAYEAEGATEALAELETWLDAHPAEAIERGAGRRG